MSNTAESALNERIYQVVQQVPRGMVATYGDIAAILVDCDARTVGYALNEVPKGRDTEIPWQRIINSEGGISTRGGAQRKLLEAEGLVFDARDRVSLARYRWAGPTAEWAAAHGCRTLPTRKESRPQEPDEQQLRLF